MARSFFHKIKILRARVNHYPMSFLRRTLGTEALHMMRTNLLLIITRFMRLRTAAWPGAFYSALSLHGLRPWTTPIAIMGFYLPTHPCAPGLMDQADSIKNFAS